MSSDTGRATEVPESLAPWSDDTWDVPRGFRGFSARATRRRPGGSGQITEARGPAASMLPRRAVPPRAADCRCRGDRWGVCADGGVRARSLQLTWARAAALPILLVCAKLFGLYDRDETLLRKTTLDEAPKLLHVATLCALVAWLAGGLLVAGTLDRHEALFLWLRWRRCCSSCRTFARGVGAAHRAARSAVCSSATSVSAQAIDGKLSGHGGVKAKMVAHLDLDKAAPWSTDTLLRRRACRRFATWRAAWMCTVRSSRRAAPTRGEMLDLVRTLKAVGVRVSVLPRLLEVVGSSVEFDDLHGITVMGVRRFELTRSSAMVKRAFDLVGASLGLLAVAPLLVVIAVAIKLDSRGPVFFRQLRVGSTGKRFYMLKFRTMVPDAEAMKDSLRHRNEAQEGLFKIADDPRVTRVGRASCARRRWMSCRSW